MTFRNAPSTPWCPALHLQNSRRTLRLNPLAVLGS